MRYRLRTLMGWLSSACIAPGVPLTAQTVDASRATAGIAAGFISVLVKQRGRRY